MAMCTVTVTMKFGLAFGAPGFNMMLASWLASFVLTCELNSVAITVAAHALGDGAFDTSRCLHVITNIDIMADNINDRWEQAQVICILGAVYGVYSEEFMVVVCMHAPHAHMYSFISFVL
jgi:hypothetical protein